jgi:hypothetical protein
MSPWLDASDPTLAYGFVATSASTASCGDCFEMDFTGEGHLAANDPGSIKLHGKRMIVQATTIREGVFDDGIAK